MMDGDGWMDGGWLKVPLFNSTQCSYLLTNETSFNVLIGTITFKKGTDCVRCELSVLIRIQFFGKASNWVMFVWWFPKLRNSRLSDNWEEHCILQVWYFLAENNALAKNPKYPSSCSWDITHMIVQFYIFHWELLPTFLLWGQSEWFFGQSSKLRSLGSRTYFVV